jgi:uncharacterized protein YydD (DUF2326 family)
MKLKKLYCNKPKIFPPIHFNEGLNVVLGEIRDPKNRGKTTHNIGKTTFIRIVDFCLLKGHSSSSFWRKQEDVFSEFIFFLEFSYSDGFITIMRSFGNDSRVNIKKHQEEDLDLSIDDTTWNHEELTLSNAKDILDGYLDFEIIKPWNYRKITSYLLRIQDDYSDIFRLAKHAGRDIDWKPPLAQLLGLNGGLIEKAYLTDESITGLENRIVRLEAIVSEFKDDPDRLNGLIQLKREEIESYEKKLQDFDFKDVEDDINKNLVDEIESEISELNSQKYYIDLDIKSINESIETKSNFSLKNTEKIFNEAGVLFGEQVKKSYKELIDFNRRITKERKEYLVLELKEKKVEKKKVIDRLSELNTQRISALSKIKERETFNKYKKLGDELSEMKLSLLSLENLKKDLQKLEKAKDELDRLNRERSTITKKMQEVLKNPSKRYSRIKSSYNSNIKKVLNRTAIINTKVNKNGNYSFDAPFVDDEGTSTSEDDGHTFKKLQCIAFDSAIVMNSLDKKFPHFVIHDGVLETLENRMRLNLIELFYEEASQGLQEIITVLDTHLPIKENGEKLNFKENELIRVLHDQGDEGKLFKMPSW